MNKYKRLAKDYIVYMVGSFGNKLVSLVMVSFYTFKLTSEEYGNIDITLATFSLLMPIISLCMHEAVLRFSIESPNDSFGVLTNALTSMVVCAIVFMPISILFSYLGLIHSGLIITFFLILCEGISLCLGQYCRAINKQVAYAVSGIIGTFVLAGSNILILNFFENKVHGYFFSIVLSYLVPSIYLFVASEAWKKIKIKNLDWSLYKNMAKYAIPLVPNSLLWWIMSVSDKYTILFFCGAAANGLYGVAGKIPTILSTFTGTFMSAWRNSAILEDKSEDKSQFQTKIFGLLSSFYFVSISGIFVVVKFVTRYLLGADYIDSWKYVPFLLLSAVFSGFSSFLGTEYLVTKRTGRSLKTTIFGALLNVVLNIPLVYFIGINGAAVATMLSHFITWVIRIRDTKDSLKITYNIKVIAISIALLFLQSGLLYITEDILQLVTGSIIFVIVVMINFKELRPVFAKFETIILKKG